MVADLVDAARFVGLSDSLAVPEHVAALVPGPDQWFLSRRDGLRQWVSGSFGLLNAPQGIIVTCALPCIVDVGVAVGTGLRADVVVCALRVRVTGPVRKCRPHQDCSEHEVQRCRVSEATSCPLTFDDSIFFWNLSFRSLGLRPFRTGTGRCMR